MRRVRVVLILAGCTVTGVLVGVSRAQPRAAVVALVWTRQAGERDWVEPGPAWTYAVDANGRVQARTRGVTLSVGGQRVTPVPRPRNAWFVNCGRGEGDGGGVATKRGRVSELDLRGPQRQVPLWETLPSEVPIGERTVTDELVASIGPLLFVRRRDWEYSCGAAHGEWRTSLRAIDLRSLRTVDILPATRLTRTRLAAAQRDAMEHPVSSDEDCSDSLWVVAAFPVLDAHGQRLRYQVTCDVPYSGSDGDWSAYSTSRYVDVNALGPVLSPFAGVPAPVRRFISAHPELPVGGFTTVASEDVDGSH